MSLDNFKSSVVRPSSSKSRKLAAALGLILGSTTVAVGQVGCGIEAYGTGVFPEGDAQGGNDGGVNSDVIFPVEDATMDTGDFPDAKEDADAGTLDAEAGLDASSDADADVMDADAGLDASADADADTKDAEAGMDASSDADADVMDADAGFDASADADAAVDADAGCVDIPVIFKNMTEYVAIVYRGGCAPVNRAFVSFVDGSSTFNTGTLDLCLKAGDVPIVQVKDGVDKNSLEFESAGAPTEVQVKKVPSGLPLTYAQMDILCAASSGYTTVTDVNPVATEFKYEGNSATDPTDAFRPKF